MSDGCEWQPKINEAVWLVDRDMTLSKRWVDEYSNDHQTIHLRTIQNPKKFNNGSKPYPAKGLGTYIHTNYQDARLCIKMNAVKFN